MPPGPPKPRKSSPQVIPFYASIVVDSDTGVILHQANPDKKLHPASLTKVMTLLMLFEAIERGETSLNDSIKISKKAAAAVPSKLGLAPGSTIRVKDAILALVTKSANDIALAVAEHVGETEDRFAIAMTGRARELGMNNTTFRNASGLHDPGQISSARDMAIMARYVINRYPDYYRYFSTKNFSYKGQNYHNHNHLMKSYKGMDGMKTGFINASGFNLIGSAVRGNTRLIGVVFGGKSANSRNAHMKELLDAGFKKGTTPEFRNAAADDALGTTIA
ncbi:MAG TPA: D-alanyl-D-alanine carboxypeptidase family protein, partial [Alphaproteobacteria bacterium]|nr:D-alanyl-D-alanine carboxypeptidase family protein [Alphaproteobacteria bacterium]